MMSEMENNLNFFSALFPVVFFDGEREIDLGTVLINSSTNFKSFQSLISHKIGISPHQITIYFHRTPHHNLLHRRRHPVTNKFNFSSILLDNSTSSSSFWVVLKRSRRLRRRSHHPYSPENSVILRRNPNLGLDYTNKMRVQLEMERERYINMMSLNLNSNVYSDLSLFSRRGFGISSDDGASSSGCGSSDRVVVCDMCLNPSARREGETVAFHWCKNDAVTVVFRSPAGPIAPPLKTKQGN